MSYPEPPHYASASVDLGLSPEPYGAYPRSAHDYPTTMGFDSGVVYAEAPYMYSSGRASPSKYPDDGDMHGPSSDLSIASASSSNVGSPLSSHGQMAAVSGWAGPHGFGITPGIVDQGDYFPGSGGGGGEYSFVDSFHPSYDFPPSKAPGFVGELAQIPTSSRLSPHPPSHGGRRVPRGSISSCLSSDSGSATLPPKCSSPGLALDTGMEQQQVPLPASPATASVSYSVSSAPVFASATSSAFPCSREAWSSPPLGGSSPARPSLHSPHSRRLVTTPFFSQSSGHFVPPLETSYPSLIHPDVRPMAMPNFEPLYPAPPNRAYPASPELSVSASPQLRTGPSSPFHNNNYPPPYSPYQPPVDPQRPGSLGSYPPNFSGEQPYSGDESREKQRCPHRDCGKMFKDIKSHMLTHQNERPEKCPIAMCEYHVKGFARKYDKNRHTLTHYKGTMVCGFCPGSGSASEKSFNRADVFKRHLTAVHGVEQTPPNSRKKAAGASSGAGGSGSGRGSTKLTGYAPDATGKCSTCSQTFSNAQDFYEHLDDCVLRIVQQEDPAEAINAKRLAEVENDPEVHNTLEKNRLPTTATAMPSAADEADDEDDNMDEDGEFDKDAKGNNNNNNRSGKKSIMSPTRRTKGGNNSNNPPNGVQKSRGMTYSRGGVPLQPKSRGRKSRKDYPSSWGFDQDQVNMKKRVLAVFDGPRRLAKDDMMLSTEHEVRIKLEDGKSWVTDLDLQTLKRANGFLNATDEERGPWISDDPTEEQLQQMQ